MSLAMYAAPFNNDLNQDNNNEDNIINRKRQTHNKTQKKIPKEGFNQEKVNSVLENIHKNSKIDDDDDNLGNFNPPPPPESIGAIKKMSTENMQNMMSSDLYSNETIGKPPMPNNLEMDKKNLNLDLNNYNVNYGDNNLIEEYYNKFLPNVSNNNVANNAINPNNRQFYKYRNQIYSQDSDNSQDILLKKLNYMINLLEEQQDEKTNNVTEEVVLYSFLGVFIIFIVDSFARAGKYVR